MRNVQLALLLPATTVTLSGISTTASPPAITVRATVVSEVTALPNVTFPVEFAPPVTMLGENVSAVGTLGVTVKVPVLVLPLAVAEICTEVADGTEEVLTTNDEDEVPASTVTEAGIDATAEFPETTFNGTNVSLATTRLKVTFPVLFAPPMAVAGENETEVGVFGLTVKVADFETPFAVADSCTGVATATSAEVNENDVLVEPGARVIELGMEAKAPPPLTTVIDTAIGLPEVVLKVTFPVPLAPATTVAGVSVKLVGTLGVTVKVPVLVLPLAVAEI